MALFAAQVLTAAGGQRAERHALIDFDVVSDFGCLADDDARAVVDKEILADRRARVDVDTRQAVGVLCHDARNQRHAEQKQLVRNTRCQDREKPGIGADDFVLVVRRGVAVIRRLDIRFDVLPDLRDPVEERKGDFLGRPDDRRVVHSLILGRVFQHDSGLLFEVVDDILQQDRDIVPHGVGAVIAVAVITGINDDLELFENVDDDALVGIFKHLDFVYRSSLSVVVRQLFHEIIDLILNVVSHPPHLFLIFPIYLLGIYYHMVHQLSIGIWSRQNCTLYFFGICVFIPVQFSVTMRVSSGKEPKRDENHFQ